jgi:hypothetical protein
MSGGSGKGNSQNKSQSESNSVSTYNIDNSVRTSDFGAVSGAVEISKEALGLGREALQTGASAWRTAADLARDVNSDSLDFAGNTLEYLASSAESTQKSLLDGARDLFKGSVASISELAMQTSATGDDRVAKVATFAVLAVAAAMILPAVFRK